MKVTDHNDQTMNRAHQLFSDIFLQQIQYNKIYTPSENISSPEKKISLVTGPKINHRVRPDGHGPFVKLDDGSVCYDLYNPPLLGYSHPLSIKNKIWIDLEINDEFENDQHQINKQIVQLFLTQNKFDNLNLLTTTAAIEKSIADYKIIDITQASNQLIPIMDNEQVIVKISNQFQISREVIALIKDRNLKVWIEETNNFARGHKYSLVAFDYSEINENIYIYSFLSAMQNELSVVADLLIPSKSVQESIAQLLFEKKAFTYLARGQFFTKGGKVEKIQSLMESLLKTLKIASSYQVNGMQFSFSLACGQKYNRVELLTEFFKRGLMIQVLESPCDNLNVKGTFPLAITAEHVEEVFEIINNSLNAIKNR